MKVNPKVSVLIPVYKTDPSYLKAAIDSILNQTYTNFELLILDDCPKDDREQLVTSYNDSRIVYKKNSVNQGISKSRNILLDLSRGEYLCIFDHDDISLPTRLEKQVSYLDNNPEVGVVGSWADYFPIKKKENYRYPTDNESIKIMLMNKCAVLHSSSMLRKDVLVKNNIRYEERFSPAEDYMLWCRLIEFTQFHNIPEVLLHYRQHEFNTTNLQCEKMTHAAQEVKLFARNKFPSLYFDYQKKYSVRYIKFYLLFIPFSIRFEKNFFFLYLGNSIKLIKLKVYSDY